MDTEVNKTLAERRKGQRERERQKQILGLRVCPLDRQNPILAGASQN